MTEAKQAPDHQDEKGEQADAADRSLLEDVRILFEDGRSYAEAEFAFQKERMAYTARRGKAALFYLGVAVFLFFFVLVALVVGTLLALAEWLGAIAATAIVAGVLLLALVLAAALARRNLQRIMRAFAEDGT